jgi:hypothetical protein
MRHFGRSRNHMVQDQIIQPRLDNKTDAVRTCKVANAATWEDILPPGTRERTNDRIRTPGSHGVHDR